MTTRMFTVESRTTAPPSRTGTLLCSKRRATVEPSVSATTSTARHTVLPSGSLIVTL